MGKIENNQIISPIATKIVYYTVYVTLNTGVKSITVNGYGTYTSSTSLTIESGTTLSWSAVSRTGYSLNNSSGSTTVTGNTSISPTASVSTSGTHNGRSWIDLGLSVLWATYDVGSYTWGSTSSAEGSGYQSWSTRSISGGPYDTARNLWGGEWRMPTDSECSELVRNCSGGINSKTATATLTSNLNSNTITFYGTVSDVNKNNVYVTYWTATPFNSNGAIYQLIGSTGNGGTSSLGVGRPGDGRSNINEVCNVRAVLDKGI